MLPHSMLRLSTEALRASLVRETGARIDLNEHGNDLFVNLIVVPTTNRSRGSGTRIMNALVNQADRCAMRMRLTPNTRDAAFGTTSRARLVKFYKRFGFVENKGRHRDFSLGAAEMYREPKQR